MAHIQGGAGLPVVYMSKAILPCKDDTSSPAALGKTGVALDELARQVLQVLNGLCADPTVEVEVVAEEQPLGGLAAVPSLYSIHLSREVL